MVKKILIDDLDTSDENIFFDVKYKGIAFTGIAYDFRENFHSEYSYKNGLGQGRCFSVYSNGRLSEEFFLENGEELEGTSWYETGVKKEYYKKTPYLKQYWNKENVLILEENDECIKHWYHNGSLKSMLEKKKEYIYYGCDGEFAVKINTKEDYFVMDKNKMTFNMSYINKHYMDLLQDHDFYGYFVIWLSDLRKNKQGEIICNMIKSDILWQKYDGIDLAVKYKIYDAIPYIKLETDNDEKPPDIRDVRSLPAISFGLTIAQRAKIALNDLEK
jgi:hypothetical protein